MKWSVTVQRHSWRWSWVNYQPDVISCLQMNRHLNGKRFEVPTRVCRIRRTVTNTFAVLVQIYTTSKSIRWSSRWETNRPRCWEKICSRSRGREFACCQIHGSSHVKSFKVKWNGNICLTKAILWSLHVEISRWRFDIFVANPRLETYEWNEN